MGGTHLGAKGLQGSTHLKRPTQPFRYPPPPHFPPVVFNNRPHVYLYRNLFPSNLVSATFRSVSPGGGDVGVGESPGRRGWAGRKTASRTPLVLDFGWHLPAYLQALFQGSGVTSETHPHPSATKEDAGF